MRIAGRCERDGLAGGVAHHRLEFYFLTAKTGRCRVGDVVGDGFEAPLKCHLRGQRDVEA